MRGFFFFHFLKLFYSFLNFFNFLRFNFFNSFFVRLHFFNYFFFSNFCSKFLFFFYDNFFFLYNFLIPELFIKVSYSKKDLIMIKEAGLLRLQFIFIRSFMHNMFYTTLKYFSFLFFYDFHYFNF